MTKQTLFLCGAAACLVAASTFFYFLTRPSETDSVITLYPDAYSREYYLNLCGWEVSLLDSREIQIPQVFNDTYAAYSQLQTKQGFSLSDYKGETAVLYTYAVHNYGGDAPVRAELLLCDNVLIGASLYSLAENGFQCGLRGETLMRPTY